MKRLKVSVYDNELNRLELFYTDELCWGMFDRERLFRRYPNVPLVASSGQYRLHENDKYSIEVVPVNEVPY